MEILNLEEKVSRITKFSETGRRIDPDEIYFEGESHGRKVILTIKETENFIGLRDVSTEERKKLAKSGDAMPDGSFPIANCKDASNAIHAIGRAKSSDRSAVKTHIRKRVKELGCTGSTFENWK